MAKKAIIYTTPTCPYCNSAKEFFKQNNVNYEEIDVTKDPKLVDEMVNKSGQMGVPVIDVEGTIIIGYNREKLKKALGL